MLALIEYWAEAVAFGLAGAFFVWVAITALEGQPMGEPETDDDLDVVRW